MNRIALTAVLALGLSAPIHAQDALPYTEGAVVEVTAVNIEDGEFDNYKPIMEAQKQAKIILDYGVYSNMAGKDDDADLYLVVVYPNLATLDNLRARIDPLVTKVSGQSVAQSNQAFAERSKMRDIMGTELLRELKLK